MPLSKILLLFALAIGVFFLASAQAAPRAAAEKLEFVTASGSHVFQVEVARTIKERERGLMNRRELPRDGGMLFLFASRRRSACG